MSGGLVHVTALEELGPMTTGMQQSYTGAIAPVTANATINVHLSDLVPDCPSSPWRGNLKAFWTQCERRSTALCSLFGIHAREPDFSYRHVSRLSRADFGVL